MSRIDSHIDHVQRQLILDRFIDFLARSFFVLGILALVVVVMDRIIHLGLPPQMAWVGLGMVMVAAIVLTVMHRPSKQAAAVAIDEKLGLKEKFSTALSVRKMNDPFAQAVVRDAEQTAASVRLAGQFPVTFPRIGTYALIVAGFAVSAYKWLPEIDLFNRKQAAIEQKRKADETEQAKKIANDALLKLESLPVAMKQSEEVKLAKRHLEELVKQPMPTREATARRVAEALADAEKGLQKSIEQNKAFADSKAAEKLLSKLADQKPIDGTGPVAEAQRKLVKGDVENALKDIEKAVEDFKKDSPKQQEEKAAQMQQLAQQLNKVAQDPAAQQKLQQQLQQMGANQQQIQQAQQMIQQAAQGDKQAQQQLQQAMQQMAQGMNAQQQQQLAQAMQQAMQNANAQANAQQMAQAAQQMAQAMAQAAQQQGQQGNQNNQQQQQAMQQAAQQLQQQLQNMQAAQQDAKQMQQAQQQMQQAMQQAAGQCQGNGQGQGQDGQADKPGDGQAGNWKPGQGNPNQGNGPGGGEGQAWGDRSGKTAAPFKEKGEVDAGVYNDKGKHLASTYVKDKSVKGEAKLELQKAIEAAEADSADDIDDSRVDRRTQEAVKRYFEVMKKEVAATPEKK